MSDEIPALADVTDRMGRVIFVAFAPMLLVGALWLLWKGWKHVSKGHQ